MPQLVSSIGLRATRALLVGVLLAGLVACSPPAGSRPGAGEAASEAAVLSTAPDETAAAEDPIGETSAESAPLTGAILAPNAMERTLEVAAQRTGGTGAVRVTLARAARPEEAGPTFVGPEAGVDPSWRAAAWTATLVGSLEVGTALLDQRVAWEKHGEVDAAEIGALMTVALVTGALGDDLKPDVGLVGAIHPDGTLGPLDWPRQPLEAAAGLKYLLLPFGQLSGPDDRSPVPLSQSRRGQQLGVRLQEVATLDEAYDVLAARRPARSQPPTRVPELPRETAAGLRAKIAELDMRSRDHLERLAELDPRLGDLLADSVTEAEALRRRADQAVRQGALGVALDAARRSATIARGLALGAEAGTLLLESGDVETAAMMVAPADGRAPLELAVERVGAPEPSSAGDALVAARAWAELLELRALAGRVEEELSRARLAPDEREQLARLGGAALLVAAEASAAEAADDALRLGLLQPDGSRGGFEPAALDRWASLFEGAAGANLAAFEAVALDRRAASLGVPPEQLGSALATHDRDYQLVSYGLSAAAREFIDSGGGSGAARSAARLGFALRSYVSSALLLTRQASLGAELDPAGRLVNLGRERTLSTLLDAAADRAKERLATMAKAGGDPSEPLLLYHAARAGRDGAPDRQLAALRGYWLASTYARLFVLLRGGP